MTHLTPSQVLVAQSTNMPPTQAFKGMKEDEVANCHESITMWLWHGWDGPNKFIYTYNADRETLQ